jgi:acyl carrier protein
MGASTAPHEPMISAQSSPDQILAAVRGMLVELFEVPMEDLRPDSTLFEELDLASLDAADMRTRLNELTGRLIPETRFQEARTVADVVSLVQELLNA